MAMRLAGVVFALAAIVLTGWWISQWIAPRPVGVLASSAGKSNAIDPASALHIFGDDAKGSANTSSAGGLELTGVYAYGDGRGFAVLRTTAGPVVAFVGQEASPGLTLARVDKDGIVLSGGGHETRLNLTAESARPTAAESAKPTAVESAQQPTAEQPTAAPQPIEQRPANLRSYRDRKRARAAAQQQESE